MVEYNNNRLENRREFAVVRSKTVDCTSSFARLLRTSSDQHKHTHFFDEMVESNFTLEVSSLERVQKPHTYGKKETSPLQPAGRPTAHVVFCSLFPIGEVTHRRKKHDNLSIF